MLDEPLTSLLQALYKPAAIFSVHFTWRLYCNEFFQKLIKNLNTQLIIVNEV